MRSSLGSLLRGAFSRAASSLSSSVASAAPPAASSYRFHPEHFREVPPVPLALGLAGAIPFVALAAPVSASIGLEGVFPEAYRAAAQAGYGAAILSFLGGTQWGFAASGYGAEIVGYDRYTESREAIGDAIAAERGLTLIPPFDAWAVMAGQGTLARELFATEAVDTLVVCVGGGGLISGCATVAKALGDVRVIGVEPAAGNDVEQSLAAGERVALPETPVTIADGQQTMSCGDKTFAVMRERVDEIALVSDEEIVAAMRFAFERLNIVLEPSGASALAAVLSGRLELAGQRVGVTLSGGNVDLARFSALTAIEPPVG